jgi:hypothetical protein
MIGRRIEATANGQGLLTFAVAQALISYLVGVRTVGLLESLFAEMFVR